MRRHLLPATLLLALFTMMTANATTFTVSSSNDAGPGSLRDALTAANFDTETTRSIPDTIYFAPLATPRIISLRSALPNIHTPLLMDAGTNIVVIRRDAANSRSDFALMVIDSGFAVNIKGCIRFSGGTASGIQNRGTLTMEDSWITGNSTDGLGGGIYNDGIGKLTLNRCTIDHNIATGKSSSGHGGGGICNNGRALTMTNCTVTENQIGAAGFGASGGGIESNAGTAFLTHCTIVGNTAADGFGGGIYIGGGTASLRGCIVAKNTASGGPDTYGAVVSNGNNLIGSVDDTAAWRSHDMVGSPTSPIDPMLGPLHDSDACTSRPCALTMVPRLGSPAVDGGGDSTSPGIDQRGQNRPRGHHVDIGAVELNDCDLLKDCGPTLNNQDCRIDASGMIGTSLKALSKQSPSIAWGAISGTPSAGSSPHGSGCTDGSLTSSGYLELWGTPTVHDGVAQAFAPAPVPGDYYKLQACAAWKANPSATPPTIRFFAFSGPYGQNWDPSIVGDTVGIISAARMNALRPGIWAQFGDDDLPIWRVPLLAPSHFGICVGDTYDSSGMIIDNVTLTSVCCLLDIVVHPNAGLGGLYHVAIVNEVDNISIYSVNARVLTPGVAIATAAPPKSTGNGWTQTMTNPKGEFSVEWSRDNGTSPLPMDSLLGGWLGLQSAQPVDSAEVLFEFRDNVGNVVCARLLRMSSKIALVESDVAAGPTDCAVLLNITPNPVSHETTIEFFLPEREPDAEVRIADAAGRVVRRVIDGQAFEAGLHEVTVDCSDLPAGVYYYTLRAGTTSLTRKLIVAH